ncbi:hypothetical protein BsWGS_26088 [Bradybaena similaris]
MGNALQKLSRLQRTKNLSAKNHLDQNNIDHIYTVQDPDPEKDSDYLNDDVFDATVLTDVNENVDKHRLQVSSSNENQNSSSANKTQRTPPAASVIDTRTAAEEDGLFRNITIDKQQTSAVQNNSQAKSRKCQTFSETQNGFSAGGEKTTVKVPPSPRYSVDSMKDVHARCTFTLTICKQNEVANSAIQSLDNLSEQIAQHIASIQALRSEDDGFNVPVECVQSSLILIRRLLLDAQSKFRHMVDENRQLGIQIDSSIQAVNREVSMLRTELASAKGRLKQMNVRDPVGRADKAIQVDDLSGPSQQRPGKCNKEVEELKMTIQTLTRGNEQLVEDYKHLLEDHDQLKLAYDELRKTNESLKSDVAKMDLQLQKIGKGSDDLPQAEAANIKSRSTYGEIKLELIQARQELIRAKEVLQDMKSDRKRLKGEKLDLLTQMKQLYTTLEEKETELREFIRNYEQRVKESDEMVKQFAKEKETVEREKWEIINRAKEAAERAMFLKAQLESKEQHIKELEAELKEIKDQLDSHNSTMLSSSTAPASDGNINHDIDDDDDDDDEVFPSVNANGFSTMEESSVLNCIFIQDHENELGQQAPSVLSTSPVSTTESIDASGPMFKWFTQSSDFDLPLEPKLSKHKKKKNFGSLSRVFSRSRMRRSIASPHVESVASDGMYSSQKLCVLSQDNYQEKLNTIEKMVGVNMKDWRAPQVLAWLEITLAMPMYAQSCLTNVKSGRVLLGLSDSELSAALGVVNPMHRRKLRLAIEQHRNPNDIKYLKASEMDPTWIAHRFLPDLGLPQYTDIFEEQLCDGHVLNTLTRRDLEKHFSVHRKFHQSSILHAVELLRRIDFNKEKLYHRRNLSEDKDVDLIVWTNERLMKWIRSVDLGEYCENLLESGVHGAVIVLEPSFSADTLASILGIPPSKSYLRRHLASELDNILKPARAALDSTDGKEKVTNSSSSSTSKVSTGSQDKEHSVFEDMGRRKSVEEGRALLAELLGRKYETTSS